MTHEEQIMLRELNATLYLSRKEKEKCEEEKLKYKVWKWACIYLFFLLITVLFLN